MATQQKEEFLKFLEVHDFKKIARIGELNTSILLNIQKPKLRKTKS